MQSCDKQNLRGSSFENPKENVKRTEGNLFNQDDVQYGIWQHHVLKSGH